MKLIRNTENDRVLDVEKLSLSDGRHLDVVTSSLSLFSFDEPHEHLRHVIARNLDDVLNSV